MFITYLEVDSRGPELTAPDRTLPSGQEVLRLQLHRSQLSQCWHWPHDENCSRFHSMA